MTDSVFRPIHDANQAYAKAPFPGMFECSFEWRKGAAVGLDDEEHCYAVVEAAELAGKGARPVVIGELPGKTVIGVAPGETTRRFRRALEVALMEWRRPGPSKGSEAGTE